MMTIPPLAFEYTEDEVLRPLQPRVAAKHLAIGERYIMVPWEDRSQASHRQYFASVNEGWQNLPDDMAARFPSPDHLRRYCLIKAGYSDSKTLVASSKAEAIRLAAFIEPIDAFSVVTVQGATVNHFTAKSQSMRAMGRKEFEDSKRKVLDLIANMLGVAPAQLEQSRAA